jgi:hypothetical protein
VDLETPGCGAQEMRRWGVVAWLLKRAAAEACCCSRVLLKGAELAAAHAACDQNDLARDKSHSAWQAGERPRLFSVDGRVPAGLADCSSHGEPERSLGTSATQQTSYAPMHPGSASYVYARSAPRPVTAARTLDHSPLSRVHR